MTPLASDLAQAIVADRRRRAGEHFSVFHATTPRRSTTMLRSLTSRTAVVLYAVIGVLVLISGTATAAAMITGKQIKDNSVHGRDIQNASLTGVDVKNRSLTPADFTGSLQGPAGPTGPSGPAGPAGPAGPQGPAGVSGVQYVSNAMDIGAGKTASWPSSCPVGKVVVGGGVSSTNPRFARVLESAPLDENGSGWWVVLRNEHTSPISAFAWAVCARA